MWIIVKEFGDAVFNCVFNINIVKTIYFQIIPKATNSKVLSLLSTVGMLQNCQ